jgi:polyphosphate kinase
MSKQSPTKKPQPYLNRELSWMDFNARVLAEAERPETPLLERLRFLAIVSNNLDEFFMVRVAMLHRALEAKAGPLGPDRRPPAAVLRRISEQSHELFRRQYACLLEECLPALREAGASLVGPAEYTAADTEALQAWFDEQIYPSLTPMAVDPAHPFPLLTSGGVYIYLTLVPRPDAAEQQFYAQTDTVLVQVPGNVNRFVRLPAAEEGQERFALLDDVIVRFAERLVRGYDVTGAHPVRVLRDADITVEEEQAENLLAEVERQLRDRRRGSPVRLELREDTPARLAEHLRQQLDLERQDVYEVPGFIDLTALFGLVKLIDRPDLLHDPWPPVAHPLFTRARDIFATMQEQDFILHPPYQDFRPTIDLAREAADDPDVLAIKMTLYRVSGDSPIVAALMRAAENGKQVTALVELRARFDEEANIQWARRLERAGAHVIYGVVGYKTHAKALLVVRREEEGIRRYVHLSTGNYNDSTARVYTDIGYFTTRPEFGADLSAFFNVISGYSLPPEWNRIEMSPTGLRERLVALIDREIERHSRETPGRLRFKMNSLIDAGIIDALYRASQAGVEVELIVRGMSRLRAGVPGLSERIRLVSIVDRFLEHSRIYHFRNGGNDEVYLASADCMERNLNSRLELLFPILDEAARGELIRVLDICLADNCHAWELRDDTYERLEPAGGEEPRRSQAALYARAREAAEASKQSRRQGVFEARQHPEA